VANCARCSHVPHGHAILLPAVDDTKMRALAISTVSLACLSGCAFHSKGLRTGDRYRLFFPPITLATADGERIESVEVTMSCGRFRSLTDIPSDWSAHVISPVSEVTTLQAIAGHGSTTLWSMQDWNGSISISVEDACCFDVTAVVGTTASKHRFARSDLILKQ
jgi:hypothetical protein